MWDKAIESVKSAVKPLNPVKSAEIGKEFEF
jgi:hypothetical protein